MSTLFTPFLNKKLKLKNRIVMAPMCQFSVDLQDGVPNNWHFVHYVSRAVGGAGLIIVEMTSVDPEGRITDEDLGLWSDNQIPAYRAIVDEVHKQGAKIGIQIAHAGRKAEDAKPPVGASDIPVEVILEESKHGVLIPPRALTTEEVKITITKFKEAARRAVEAGFDTIEIHGAHGYLIHQFLSPKINDRKDEYGQDLSKFGVEIIESVRSVIPKEMPLIMRMSAIEYVDGGYKIDHAIEIAKRFKEAGVDIFHVSTGGEGIPGKLKPGNYPGYQVQFAREFKKALSVPVIAVGMLNDPHLAEEIVANEDADLVAVGRGMLNDPYWGIHAMKEIMDKVIPPKPYKRGIR